MRVYPCCRKSWTHSSFISIDGNFPVRLRNRYPVFVLRQATRLLHRCRCLADLRADFHARLNLATCCVAPLMAFLFPADHYTMPALNQICCLVFCCYAFYDNNGKESYVGDNSLLQNVMVTDLQYMTLECCGEEFEINYNNSGTMEGNIHQGHSSIRNITVKKIVPRNYFEGKSMF